MKTNQRFLVSRNKTEGYYAGHYRAYAEIYGRLYPLKAWRWSHFAMREFYPPRFGNVFRLLDKGLV